jgi:hypothetical protein
VVEGLQGTRRRHLERDSMGQSGNVSVCPSYVLSYMIQAAKANKWHVMIVFALAQESAKRTKRWYEDSDKGRRS